MKNLPPVRHLAVFWLTLIVTSLAIVSSAGGLLIDDLYHDPELIKQGWIANDIVTLLISPFLPVAFLLTKRGSERARLIWLGIMSYMFYNFSFYLFGASFNKFFLIYVALFTASLYSIIIGLIITSNLPIRENASHKNHKYVSVFLFCLAIPLLIVELRECFDFIYSGKKPEIPTLIFALDLSLVVPAAILSSILLWKRNPWGKVLGAMVLVKTFAYGTVLVAATILIAASPNSKPDPLLPFYLFLVTGGLIFGYLLLKDVGPKISDSTRA
jgi:hypothetical protein